MTIAGQARLWRSAFRPTDHPMASRRPPLISSARRTACHPSGCRPCRDLRPANRRVRSSRPPLRLRWQPRRPHPAEQRRSRRPGFPRPIPASLPSCVPLPGPAHHPGASQARSQPPSRASAITARACGEVSVLEGREPCHRIHHAALRPRAGCGAGLCRGTRLRRAEGRASRCARSCGGPGLRGTAWDFAAGSGAGHRLGLRTFVSGSFSLAEEREADFDADFSGAFRRLLGCEVPSFSFVAMVIPSFAGDASRPYRGTRVLDDDNDDVAVRFARTRQRRVSWAGIVPEAPCAPFCCSSIPSERLPQPKRNYTLEPELRLGTSIFSRETPFMEGSDATV